MKLCDIDSSKYPIFEKDEAIERIFLLADEFINSLKTTLLHTECETANIVGIGNSLSGGWSAIDSDVRPFILKLKNILEDELSKSGILVEFYNYAIMANNSNKQIYDFLLTNPSENDVKEHFRASKQEWDDIFYNTPFRNYVSSETAYSFYPETDHKFLDNYSKKNLSITLMNGCTGGVLNAVSKTCPELFLHFRKSFKEDLYYLKEIILYLKSLSENNIITVGNFPYISTKVGEILNSKVISSMNKQIENITKENSCYYFDKNQLAFFQEFINPDTSQLELKLDNHPTINEQYTVLYHYLEFLIRTLNNISNENIPKSLGYRY